MRRVRWSSLPPVVTAALLLVATLGQARSSGEAGGAEAEAHLARVASVIDAVPYRIDRWIGRDVQPTQAATDLLRPNRILQRTFTDPDDGSWFSVLIVHCRDARDMLGHYPPNCYPANGWASAGQRDERWGQGERGVPARVYHFSQRRGTEREGLVILGLFATPSGAARVGPDLRLVDEASRSRTDTAWGVGQVQVIMPEATPEDVRARMWEAARAALDPVLTAMTRGTR